jgi:hypothetical protein
MKNFLNHSNFHVTVRSLGTEHLKRALSFFFDAYQTAVGFSVKDTTIPSYGHEDQPAKALVLHWAFPDHNQILVSKFPAPLDLDAVVPMVESWLAQNPYGKRPDQDGDNLRGFAVFNDTDWNKTYGESTAICAIAPHWAMFGK